MGSGVVWVGKEVEGPAGGDVCMHPVAMTRNPRMKMARGIPVLMFDQYFAAPLKMNRFIM